MIFMNYYGLNLLTRRGSHSSASTITLWSLEDIYHEAKNVELRVSDVSGTL